MKLCYGALLPIFWLFSSMALAQGEEMTSDDKVAHWDVEGLKRVAESRGLTFSVTHNKITEFLEKGGDIRNITGAVRPADFDISTMSDKTVVIQEATDLPAKFDWREQVAGGMQPIRNQYTCGSCWAFSVTAVLESLVRIAHPGTDTDLAEQTLVSSCSGAGTCAGGYFSAFDFLKAPGLPSESQDPYRAADTACRGGLVAQEKIATWSYVVSPSGGSPTTAQIKTAIREYGPVSVDVNASFGAYSSGVFNYCNRDQINHMVTLEGWDDATQSWIMRNSWGTGWGEQGYMRIRYTDSAGYKCNGIGRTVAFAVLPLNALR